MFCSPHSMPTVAVAIFIYVYCYQQASILFTV